MPTGEACGRTLYVRICGLTSLPQHREAILDLRRKRIEIELHQK
jgi:hypothetical protein